MTLQRSIRSRHGPPDGDRVCGPRRCRTMRRHRGIDVRTPLSLKSADEQKSFADLKADAAVVVAYGLLLPQAILDAPRFGCFNVHASLLPRWRGAAPIQRAIMAGDRETGISIMRMEEGLDTGPVCKAGRVAITPSTTAGVLHDKLAALGATLMVETLQALPVPCTEQSSEGVTYAKKIDKSEAHIDFSNSADEVRNHIHGLSPFPGAWLNIGNARVKVLTCEVIEQAGEAGVVLDDQLGVACGTRSHSTSFACSGKERAPWTPPHSCAAFRLPRVQGSPDASLQAHPRIQRR